MDDKILFDKIEAYLLGQLPKEERLAFEQELASNPELADEVKMHKLEHDLMEVLIADETKAQFKEWSKEDEAIPAARGNKFPIKWAIFILAILAVLSICFNYWLTQKNHVSKNNQEELKTERSADEPLNEDSEGETPTIKELEPKLNTEKPVSSDPQDLPIAENPQKANSSATLIAMAEDIYDHPRIQLTLRNNSKQNYETIQQDFDAGRFKAAITSLQNQPNLEPRAEMMLGHAHLNLNQFKEAEESFLQVLNGNDPALSDEIAGYYLLALMGQGKIDNSSFQTNLDSILNDPEHPNYELAVSIQKALKK